MATKKSVTDPTDPAYVAPVDVPVDEAALDAQIADAENALADLKAKKVAAQKQHYPKVRYHATEAPRTVADATEEAEASADGYTLDGPPVPASKDGQ